MRMRTLAALAGPTVFVLLAACSESTTTPPPEPTGVTMDVQASVTDLGDGPVVVVTATAVNHGPGTVHYAFTCPLCPLVTLENEGGGRLWLTEQDRGPECLPVLVGLAPGESVASQAPLVQAWNEAGDLVRITAGRWTVRSGLAYYTEADQPAGEAEGSVQVTVP